jgi:hypothetical protein
MTKKVCPLILTTLNGGGINHGGKTKNQSWWKDENSFNKVKSEEAARKYYSVKEYLTHGTPKVCTPPLVKGDNKFGDQKDNLWFYRKSDPLEGTIVRYSIDQNQSKKKMRIAAWRKGNLDFL